MSEEYLWNRTGESDPEIARLEEALRPLRYKPDPSRLNFSAARAAASARTHRSWAWPGAIAAAAALIAISAIAYVRVFQPSAPSAWRISWNGSATRAVAKGQLIDTGTSAARLESDFIGEVNVGPDSRLRVLRSTKDTQQLALERGTIHALIWAPPTEFIVDTPSAKTIDLGCQYTLHVAPDGTGLLNVQTGWVAFEWRKLESFIPAGASCRTWPARGPGLPYFDDAPPQLRAAAAQFDRKADRNSLETILISARPRDGLTLWHLLPRTQGAARAAVFDRFRELVKLPSTITKTDIMNGSPAAMDAAWNALDLGATDWWREWKRKW